jgi:hypothetical protein
MTTVNIRDVLALPGLKDTCVKSAVVGPFTLVDRVFVSTHDATMGEPLIEAFRSADRPGSALEAPAPGVTTSGVWVGRRPLDYRLEELLPKLRLQGIALVIALIGNQVKEETEIRLSTATLHLATRLGISLAVIRSDRSAVSIASEIDALVRDEPLRQARELIALCALADEGPPRPAQVGAVLSRAAGFPLTIFGPQEVVIWASTDNRQGATESTLKNRGLSVPIAGDESGSRIEIHGPGLSPARRDFIQPLLTLGALLLTRWYFEERDSVQRFDTARSSLMSELALVTGRVPGNLIALANSVGWPLDGWHVLISTRTTAQHSGMTPGSLVANALEARGFEVRAARYLDYWILCYTQSYQPRRETYLGLVQALEDAFGDERSATVFGVTRPRFGPDGFVKNLSEAGDLVRHGDRRKVRRTRINSRESAAGQLVREAVADPLLLKPSEDLLAELGNPENQQLLETLATYLKHESNVARTARLLDVHRNTIIARISRIEEILHASLDDPDLKLALRIAIRALSDVGTP